MKHVSTKPKARMGQVSASLLALLLLFSASQQQLKAQTRFDQEFTSPMVFQKDVKQYSMAISVNQSNSSYPWENALAGTVFNSFDNTEVNFLKMGMSHQPQFFTASATYTNTHPGYGLGPIDVYMHAVDIEAADDGGNNRYFITCLSRENNPNAAISIPYSGIFQKDKITVLKVDDNGSIVDDDGDTVPDAFDYDETSTVPYTTGCNLYPTNSVYNQSLQLLYICGYTTPDWSVYPTYPKYYNEKKSFVIAIDVDPVSPTYMQITADITFDYLSGTVPDLSDPKKHFDYDIAMRMKLMTSPNFAGNLFVTGSVNGHQNNVTSPPNDPQFDYYRSGVMNFVLDPVTLAIIEEHPYMSQGPQEPAGDNEYGIDMWEDDPTTGNYLMVGNKFKQETQEVGGINYYDYYGFDPRPDGMWVNLVNPLTLTTGGTWHSFNNKKIWAMQILPTRAIGLSGGGGQTNGNTSNFTLVGLTAENQGESTPPSVHNINAFVCDINTDYITANLSTEDVQPTKWNTYITNSGTGNIGTDANNYHFLGGGVANIMWGHSFAARNFYNFTSPQDVYDDVLLTAPKMMDYPLGTTPETYRRTLGIKHIQANADDYDFKYWDLYYTCGRETPTAPEFDAETVVNLNTCIAGNLTVTRNAANITVSSLNVMSSNPCHDYDWNNSYKNGTTGVKSIQTTMTKIYPNPAKDIIHISLSSGLVKTNVSVVLTNLHGQVVKELYNGKADNLVKETTLSLPVVASGLYIVRVYSNGAMVHQQKLSIQQ